MPNSKVLSKILPKVLPKVLVGMSGGVDSSTAAALLKEQGFAVSGVTMKLWDGPASPSAGKTHGCYGPSEIEDIEDARRVADIIGIPFHVVDLSQEYRFQVLDYFRDEYLKGRTPNPCSRCNARVKFGALVEKSLQSGLEFDYFATGHYARLQRAEDGARVLRKALDTSKDQSYFLALLKSSQLEKCLFPLGDMTKTQVREAAARLGLPIADKPDSQDFVDEGCSPLNGDTTGPILSTDGRQLGTHQGISHFTIGQRKGIAVSSREPLYVVEIDASRNAVIVGARSGLFTRELTASSLNWIAIDPPAEPIRVAAKVRARHNEAVAVVMPETDGSAHVCFDEPQMSIAPGQTVVFYRDDIVLGAGVIDKSKE